MNPYQVRNMRLMMDFARKALRKIEKHAIRPFVRVWRQVGHEYLPLALMILHKVHEEYSDDPGQFHNLGLLSKAIQDDMPARVRNRFDDHALWILIYQGCCFVRALKETHGKGPSDAENP